MKDQKTKKRSSLKINAVSNWIPLAANCIIGIVLTPLLVSHLGKQGYGIWKLTGATVGYYGLLRMGVGAGIMRFIPLYEGQGEHESLNEVVSTAVIFFSCVGLIIFLATFCLADTISAFFDGGAQFAQLIRIFGGVAGLECPIRVIDAIIRAREKWFVANIISVVTAVCRAVGLVWCIASGYGLIAMGFLVLSATVIGGCGIIAVYYLTCGHLRVRLGSVKILQLRLLIGFGIYSLVIAFFMSYSLQAQSIIVGKMISLEAVGVYGVAMVLMQNVRQLSIAPNRVLWPRFAFLEGTSNTSDTAQIFAVATKYNGLFSSAIIVMLVGVGPAFVRLWVGEGFEEIYQVLYIFAGSYFVDGLLAAIPPTMGGLGKLKVFSLWAFVEGVIGITSGILLTPLLGLKGVALGYTIAVLLVRGSISIPYICRLTGIKGRRFVIDLLWRPCAVVISAIIVFSVCPLTEFIDNWFTFIGASCGLFAVYGLTAYFLLLDEGQRGRVNGYRNRIWTCFSNV